MKNEKNILAIIPARGGSKGLKNKVTKGGALLAKMLSLKCTENGEVSSNWDKVVGAVTKQDYAIDDGVFLCQKY